jgi:hypothetical protein
MSKINSSKQKIIERALDRLERESLLKRANEAFEAIRSNPEAWKEELEEQKEWDITLNDGLEEL